VWLRWLLVQRRRRRRRLRLRLRRLVLVLLVKSPLSLRKASFQGCLLQCLPL
jgi:hypothetical protein